MAVNDPLIIAAVGIAVLLNAFEPNSLVPTTPSPLIINEVASEDCAETEDIFNPSVFNMLLA